MTNERGDSGDGGDDENKGAGDTSCMPQAIYHAPYTRIPLALFSDVIRISTYPLHECCIHSGIHGHMQTSPMSEARNFLASEAPFSQWRGYQG